MEPTAVTHPSATRSAGIDGRRDPWEVVEQLRGVAPHTHRAILQVAQRTGYAYGTVSALRWLGARVPADVQREDLTLSHHFVIARLPVEQQRRRLAEAAAEGLSGAALRRRIEAEGGR